MSRAAAGILGLALIAVLPSRAPADEDGAERSLTQVLVRVEAHRKAGAMIKALGDNQYEILQDAWFKNALAIAVLKGADSAAQNVPDLVRLWADTARTDQQVGSGALAPASTSLTERPGLPRLLSIGVERGAIEQQSDDTSTTVSTSPYVLATLMNGGDSAANYERYNALARFNLGASALLDDQSSGTGSLEYEDFSQAFLKVRLWGDRSARNPDFVSLWHQEFGGAIDAILEADGTIFDAVINHNEVNALIDAAVTRLVTDLQPAVAKGDAKALEEEFIERVSKEAADITEAVDTTELAARLVEELETLAQAYVRFANLRTDDVSAKFEGMMRKAEPSVMSLKYTLNRAQAASDFSEVGLLFQHDFERGNLIVNGGVSVYHEPERTTSGETIRDFSLAATLEATFENSILPKANDEEASPISLSGSVRVSRNEEIDDTIITAQAKLEFPFASGLRLPIAMTYASRTLDGSGDDFRVNVGVLLNGDQLFDLMKIRKLASKLK